jgi:hypothetical protein
MIVLNHAIAFQWAELIAVYRSSQDRLHWSSRRERKRGVPTFFDQRSGRRRRSITARSGEFIRFI